MSPDNLPTYIPLNQAATRYGVNVAMLRRAVEDGIMQAVRTPEGRILVASEDTKFIMQHIAKRDTLRKKVNHLESTPIGVKEAAQKYGISTGSLTRWVNVGYVRVLSGKTARGRGNKKLLNEADVAYAGLLLQQRTGRIVFTQELIPEFARK